MAKQINFLTKKRSMEPSSNSNDFKKLKRDSEIINWNKLSNYKHDLEHFLKNNLAIIDLYDFWKFYDKYCNRIKNDQLKFDSLPIDPDIFYIDIDMDSSDLFKKVPIIYHNDKSIRITKQEFLFLLHVIKLFQDFRQRTKFLNLKKIRSTQKSLPISYYKQEIITSLIKSRILLIAGDTGCGKSTQVPQFILEAGFKKVACTQPRRIACISLAKRVAQETLTNFKSTVGYQIRFEKSTRADTSIVFLTEGLLLRQASESETINSYDVIILDEVHERHLYSDFLVGIMKCMLQKKNNFKLILMSATININLFANFFSDENIQIIQVPGRLYPIEINYRPIIKDPFERKRDKFNCTPYLQIIQMIDEKYPPHQKGDLLIFLNGYSEIFSLASAVTEYSEQRKNWIVLLLHSSLSLEEQDRVFDYPPDGVRKCIISTNIAETSVTIDGIRFVIDSGKVNRMSYDINLGVNKLSEMNISQDSAKQRSGRAGRTGPGICYRLYSEEDLRNFEAFTPAEIHSVPLDSLVLNMISLGLRDINNFPFLEKPNIKAINESLEKLKFLGALSLFDDYLILTSLGDALCRLPVSLCIGKMLIMSTTFGNINAVLAVAALLSIQSPLTQDAYRSLEASNLRKPLESNHGDPISLLNYYTEWLSIKQMSGPTNVRNKMENSKVWSRKRCLEEQRFYDATKLLEQFRDILCDAGLLQKIDDGELSSSERAIRHGELKHLRSIRYRLKNENASKQKKLLKYEIHSDENQHGQPLDIRDIEFHIVNNFKKLQSLLNESSAESYKQLMMLKLIITSGFYPQIAIEDEHNSSKTVSEKLYHTKNKNYVFLRPMSYFSNNSDILELHNDDIEVPPPGYFSKRPISKKHQVLVYQSILETKKVYLVNTMRMPCIQTLLLFGKTIMTNSTLTRFVIDDFLQIDVPYFGEGKTILLKAIDLRKTWNKMLEQKLQNPLLKISDSEEKLIFCFIGDLVKFMHSDISYNVKRLLPADLKHIFRETNFNIEFIANKTLNPFDSDFKITENHEKGGLNVTEHVIYDCLIEEEWMVSISEEVLKSLTCPYCEKEISDRHMFGLLQHELCCRNMKKEKPPIQDSSTKNEVNSHSFHCDKCGKNLSLSAIGILKHKKSC